MGAAAQNRTRRHPAWPRRRVRHGDSGARFFMESSSKRIERYMDSHRVNLWLGEATEPTSNGSVGSLARGCDDYPPRGCSGDEDGQNGFLRSQWFSATDQRSVGRLGSVW
jgi:hypothetical protein